MRKKRQLEYLIPLFFSIALLVYVTFFIAPSYKLSLLSLEFSIVYVFFPLLFIFLFSLFTFIFRRKLHGLLVGSFTVLYLLFRLNGLTHPLFLLLLLALFLTLELFFSKRS